MRFRTTILQSGKTAAKGALVGLASTERPWIGSADVTSASA